MSLLLLRKLLVASRQRRTQPRVEMSLTLRLNLQKSNAWSRRELFSLAEQRRLLVVSSWVELTSTTRKALSDSKRFYASTLADISSLRCLPVYLACEPLVPP